MTFNKKTWIKSTKNKNALALAQLFGTITPASYVSVLSYQVKDLVDMTGLSDSTVRRTLKKLMASGHLLALKNSNVSGRQKVYLASFPDTPVDGVYKMALDSLRSYKTRFEWIIDLVMTGRTVHNDRSKRSKRPLRFDLPILYEKFIINLVSANDNKTAKIQLTKGEGVQLELIPLVDTFRPKTKENGRGVDTRLRTAARRSISRVSESETKTEEVLKRLKSGRLEEMLEAWSIYFDETAARILKDKIDRLRSRFPVAAIAKIVIEDGFTFFEDEPSAVEHPENIERWRSAAKDIRNGRRAKKAAKEARNVNINALNDNAKTELYRIQSDILDVEDRLRSLSESESSSVPTLSPDKKLEKMPAKTPDKTVTGRREIGENVKTPKNAAPFDIRSALSQITKKGFYNEE